MKCNNGSEKPTINQQAFPNTIKWYWSGSPYAGNSDYAWGIPFYNGFFGNDSRVNLYAVRLVRGGQ